MVARPETNLLDLLKALADESRLKILRLLGEHEYSVGDLARSVELGEPTVSHHLTRLREVGLVSLRMAGNQRYYRLNGTGLAHFKKLAVEIEQQPPAPEERVVDDAWIGELGWDAPDQQVLREHTQGRQISVLPSKRKKMLVILRWLATLFEPGRSYSELEVNEVLKSVFAEDYVSLRRELIDIGYLRRERSGGKYWLEGEAEPEI